MLEQHSTQRRIDHLDADLRNARHARGAVDRHTRELKRCRDAQRLGARKHAQRQQRPYSPGECLPIAKLERQAPWMRAALRTPDPTRTQPFHSGAIKCEMLEQRDREEHLLKPQRRRISTVHDAQLAHVQPDRRAMQRKRHTQTPQ